MPLTHQKYLQYSPFFVDTAEMSDLDWEKLNKKIDKMPQSLADFLVDAKVSEFMELLTQKYIQLSVQGSDIARLIRDVVIADVFIGDMPQELSRRLGIDQTVAREVTNLIVSQLFAPVLEDLKKVHRERFPGRLPVKPQEQGMESRVQGSGQNWQAPPPHAYPSYKTSDEESKASEGAAKHYQGENLPESGGNIIDLRTK